VGAYWMDNSQELFHQQGPIKKVNSLGRWISQQPTEICARLYDRRFEHLPGDKAPDWQSLEGSS
jgi:hypothetical protein